MKFVLMVAAGIAVGLTVALAVLIQILEQLAPLVVVLALGALVLHLVRRRSGGQSRRVDQPVPTPAIAIPPVVAPTSSRGDSDLQAPYLQWGPSAHQNLDARPDTYNARTHVRRGRAGAHPSRPVRGHRP